MTFLPEEVIDRRPVLGVYRAWSSLVSGDVDAVEPRLRVAERALAATTDDGGRLPRARVPGHRRSRGRVRAFGEVRTSLRLAGNLADMLGTTIVMADMLVPLGRLREAQRSYEQALQLAAEQGEPPPQSTTDLHVGLSELLREQGELAAAADHLAVSEALGELRNLQGGNLRVCLPR